MDEGILEVDVAGDRVVELRGVGELHGVGLITCEGEVIVQGDEGPVCGVAQVNDCHGVTVGHQEKEEEEQEEVEGEEKLKDNRTSWMVWRWCERQVRLHTVAKTVIPHDLRGIWMFIGYTAVPLSTEIDSQR